MVDAPRPFRVRSNETGEIEICTETTMPDGRPHMPPITSRYVHLSLTQAEAWKLGIDLSAEVADRIETASKIEPVRVGIE